MSFHATKPTAHPEDGDGVSNQNVGKPSHLDAAVCRENFTKSERVDSGYTNEVRWSVSHFVKLQCQECPV